MLKQGFAEATVRRIYFEIFSTCRLYQSTGRLSSAEGRVERKGYPQIQDIWISADLKA